MKQQSNNSITRRDFIRGSLTAAIGASLTRTKYIHAQDKPALSKVTVIRNESVMDAELKIDTSILKKMLDQTILDVTGKKSVTDAWLSLLKQDDIVGIVTTPHLNPTHDELVEVVKTSLINFGIAEKNIIMAQGSLDKPKKCTALICMPALKAHWLTGIGTVIKNYIMFSGRPRNYHDQNSSKLGEIWHLPEVKDKTKLILVDALHPLCDKGPQVDPRYKWAYKGLIAGLDPVAVESVCLKIISAKRELIKGEPWPLFPPPLCVEAADKVYGLGTSDFKKIEIQTIGWKEELLLS
ncbi:MAG: DUF362 domain-containing protein [Calditrichaceae bacterium]